MKTTILSLCILFVAMLASSVAAVGAGDGPRQRIRLDDNWKFTVGDSQDASSPGLDDNTWRTVTIPHDWSIESKTDPNAPTGRGGGFYPTGIGWYRQHLNVPAGWQGKRVEIEFEGVYENSEIYLNGNKIGGHPYGYTTFFVDLTDGLKYGAPNVLAVRVDNSQQPNTRWYAGSGIYRHVWLEISNPVHVSNWGVFVKTDKADDADAALSISTKVSNETSQAEDVKVVTEVLAPDGKSLGKADATCQLPALGEQEVEQAVAIAHPPLWFPETPQICQAVTQVFTNNVLVDSVVTNFGIRHLAWSAQDGLTINGKTYKLKGGCVHGDNGVLGVCAFDRAEVRKVEILKAAGFTAVRTAHNPYSPVFLDACDRLGLLVMENSFDCWTVGKNKYDYSIYFKDWWQRDLDAMLLRDRNHPSIVLWDLGNETPGIFDKPDVAAYAPKLVAESHLLDPTRPDTFASRLWPKGDDQVKIADVSWDAQDIVGTNYRLKNMMDRHQQCPQTVIISSESNPPLGQPDIVLNNSFVVGDFEWTAQDYLGEAGQGTWYYQGDPPQEPYPNHGSACGAIDILGNIKPVAKWWNAKWQTGMKLGMAVEQPEGDKKVIHDRGWGWFPIWDSWTWPGWEGKNMKVDVYTTYEATRLYLNDQKIDERPTKWSKTVYTLPYQPGTLKVVGLDHGTEVESAFLKTAGDSTNIKLIPDRTEIAADGQDLSFVKVEVVDKDGDVQPNADQLITFTLGGPGTIAGLGNANFRDENPYQGVQCHVFHGMALVVLRSSKEAGVLNLKAEAKSLTPADVQVKASSSK